MNINRPQEGVSLPFFKRREQAVGATPRENRLPFLTWVPNRLRNHFIAFCGEFVGTFLFLFMAFAATQVANAGAAAPASGTLPTAPNTSVLLYISLAFGFSLAVNAWVFFRISGGLFNPAVTLGMCLIGAVNWFRGGVVFLAQILGAICSAAVVLTLFPGPLNVRTTLSAGTSLAQGVFIEMFLTSQLVFTIFMLAAEKHKGTYLAPVGIGLSLFIAELAGVYFTGGSLNPARSFGPCVALASFEHDHWVYWVGPALGSLVAVGFYKFVKTLEYETANPGQDFNDLEAEVFNPDEEAGTRNEVRRPNVQVGDPDMQLDKESGRGVSSPSRVRSGSNSQRVSGERTRRSTDRYSHEYRTRARAGTEGSAYSNSAGGMAPPSMGGPAAPPPGVATGPGAADHRHLRG